VNGMLKAAISAVQGRVRQAIIMAANPFRGESPPFGEGFFKLFVAHAIQSVVGIGLAKSIICLGDHVAALKAVAFASYGYPTKAQK